VRRRSTRLAVEQLEDRTVPSSFTAATVSDLIADINAANAAGGSNTITLAAGKTFTLTAVNNTDVDNRGARDANGLPIIAANDNLTIQGNGDSIARSVYQGTPEFRLLDVAPGASLTLANVSLQNGGGGPGLFEGGGIYSTGSLIVEGGTISMCSAGHGGSIYSSGSLILEGGTISMCSATFGGGIYSTGSLTLDAATITNCSALGAGHSAGGGVYVEGGAATLTNVTLSSNSAVGRDASSIGPGGSAYGGGVYVYAGTVTLTNVTLSSNTAKGGGAYSSHYTSEGPGNGYGGGLYVAGGNVTLTTVTLSSNSAAGGNGNNYQGFVGIGYGGGLYAAAGTVSLSNDTVTGNSAQSGSKSKNNKPGPSFLGEGGGLYIASMAAVYLDAFTVANTTANTPDDIYGPYTLIT
jgi:hypothetical protein